MQRFGKWATGLALAGLMVAGCDKKGADNKGGDGKGAAAAPKAATAEEAIKNMIAAAEKKDIKAFIATLADRPAKMVQGVLDMADAGKTMSDALAAKKIDLGHDPTGGMTADKLFEEMGKVELVGKPEEKEGKATIKMKVTKKGKDGKEETKEKTCTAAKEGDSWKLFPPDWDEKQADDVEKSMTKMKKLFGDITEGVNKGDLKTKEDVGAAMAKAMTAGN